MRIPVSLIVLLFTFAEIAVFIAVGGRIGVLATLGLTLLASAAGVSILRRQSVATVMRVRAELAAGPPQVRWSMVRSSARARFCSSCRASLPILSA